MNLTVVAALLIGAVGGVGVWMVIVAVIAPRPDLVAALAPRPVTASQRATPTLARPVLRVRIEDRLGRLGTKIAVPARDLAILDLSRGRFMLRRIGVVLVLFLLGPLGSALIWVLGDGVTLTAPVVFGVFAAVVGWVATSMLTRDRAAARRRQMRYALVSYLTLVAMYRASGLAMEPALLRAASSSPAWTFKKIGDRIASSSREGESPWTSLSNLAGELGINELADLASIAHTAADRGAGVYSVMMARASSLRRELQKLEEAAAARATTYLKLPMLLLLLAAMGFLAFPALSNFLIT